MEVGALFVGEEQVGLPQTLEHLWVNGQGVGLEVLRQLKPRVVPPLTQEDVDSVILESTHQRVNLCDIRAKCCCSSRIKDQREFL